ncbi:MAG TPA: rhomboid family intramembrane serine protease [Vicinamibacterales bacterium]|nr:rhomboid family intramembrane serine protease [Vicinamibacterales bacterium]
MFKRQRTGSVVCPSCGNLVGVNDERCYNCGRWNPGLWGFTPVLRRLGNDLGFTPMVIGGSALLYVASLLLSGRNIGMSGLFSLLSPSTEAVFLLGASGAIPVFHFDRWWTVLSAAWLHGGLLHILFNMMWVRQLAPATGGLYGPSRLVIIYTIAGIVGFVMSSVFGYVLPGVPILGGAGFTIGASAPIFGLLGALVRYGHRTGSSLVRSQAWGYALMLFVFGLIMPGVDNWAHAGGFAGGYLAGMWLDPLTPERQDHLFIALGCIAATVLSILASVVLGFPLLR